MYEANSMYGYSRETCSAYISLWLRGHERSSKYYLKYYKYQNLLQKQNYNDLYIIKTILESKFLFYFIKINRKQCYQYIVYIISKIGYILEN